MATPNNFEPSIVEYWTVGITEFKAEQKADAAVREKNYATLLLMERTLKAVKVRGAGNRKERKLVDAPLLPGYLFIGVRPGQSLYDAEKANGISSILHFGEKPVKVPFDVIDEWMLRGDSDGIVHNEHAIPARKPYKPETRVSFAEDSPLSRLVFLVKKDAGAKAKVWLESLEGKKMRVDPEMIHAIE